MDAEGCGRLSGHYCLLDCAWFCVYKLGDSFVVVVGASASALEDRRLFVEAV